MIRTKYFVISVFGILLIASVYGTTFSIQSLFKEDAPLSAVFGVPKDEYLLREEINFTEQGRRERFVSSVLRALRTDAPVKNPVPAPPKEPGVQKEVVPETIIVENILENRATTTEVDVPVFGTSSPTQSTPSTTLNVVYE